MSRDDVTRDLALRMRKLLDEFEVKDSELEEKVETTPSSDVSQESEPSDEKDRDNVSTQKPKEKRICRCFSNSEAERRYYLRKYGKRIGSDETSNDEGEE